MIIKEKWIRVSFLEFFDSLFYFDSDMGKIVMYYWLHL